MRFSSFLLLFLFLFNNAIFSQTKRIVGIFEFDNAGSSSYNWVGRGIEEILYEKLKQVNSFSVYEGETLKRILKKLNISSSKEATGRKAFSIGKESGIEVLYLGNYRVDSDNLVVGIRLVSTYTGGALIEQTFSGKLDDIFTIFDNIVKVSIETMNIPLSNSELNRIREKPTDSIIAFEYYCKAYIEISNGSTMDIIAGYFQRAIKEDPYFWEAHYNLGVIYYNFDLYKKALKQFDTVIRERSDFYKPYYGRAIIYYVKKDYDTAINEFNTVLRFNEEHDRSYYYLGIIYGRKGDILKASEYLDKAIKINPNFAPAYYQLSLVEYKRGWYKKTINSARQALKLNPGFYRANRSLGKAYYQLNLFDESIFELNKAVKIKPNYATAYFDLGNAIYKKGAVEEIVDSYWSLIENRYAAQTAGTNNKNPIDDLSGLREKARSDKSEETIRKMISAYQKAIKYDNNFYEATYNLALTYENYNKQDSAQYYYNKTISIKPSLVQAHMRLGRIHEQQKKYDLALYEFKEVVRYEPDYFAAGPNLGEPYRNINILQTVLQDYQDKLSINPQNKEALRVVGSIYLSIGRLGQAEEYYRQLVQINPNDKTAKNTLKEIRIKMNKM